MGIIDSLDAIARTRQEAPNKASPRVWIGACDACAGEVINKKHAAVRANLCAVYAAMCQRAERELDEIRREESRAMLEEQDG